MTGEGLQLTKAGARHLATAAAWTVEGEPGDGDAGRTVLHSRSGGIGCDWDLHAVIEFINEADEVGFGSSLLGHEMWVAQGDRVVHFDVKKPQGPEIEQLTAAGYLT